MKFEELFSRLSSSSHVKGKSFEQISKWWLTNDELWSSIVKQVWLWDEWPNRNTRDLGIDLVAEGFDGTLWAVQCKAYDPESSLKKSLPRLVKPRIWLPDATNTEALSAVPEITTRLTSFEKDSDANVF